METMIRFVIEGRNAEDFIDNLYMNLKCSIIPNSQIITIDHIQALAEQLTELVARKKEEAGGEQEG